MLQVYLDEPWLKAVGNSRLCFPGCQSTGKHAVVAMTWWSPQFQKSFDGSCCGHVAIILPENQEDLLKDTSGIALVDCVL